MSAITLITLCVRAMHVKQRVLHLDQSPVVMKPLAAAASRAQWEKVSHLIRPDRCVRVESPL